jgi:hypothetical protein
MTDLIDNRLSLSEQEPALLNREEGRASYKLGRRAIVVGRNWRAFGRIVATWPPDEGDGARWAFSLPTWRIA